jgi:hypothetical protein
VSASFIERLGGSIFQVDVVAGPKVEVQDILLALERRRWPWSPAVAGNRCGYAVTALHRTSGDDNFVFDAF